MQWGLLAAVMTGCAAGDQCVSDCVFAPGESKDPIVSKAQALGGTETATLTITNKSGWDFSQGLILFYVPYKVATVPSTPLFNYVRDSSSTKGKADVLAAGLNLTVGTNAFLVNKVDHNKSVSVTVTVPAGTRITYVARVSSSTDDFVASADVPLSSGVPGTPTPFTFNGFDLSTNNNPNGLTTIGNGTTGQTPSGSSFTATVAGDCPNGPTTVSQVLLTDDFSKGALDSAWPKNAGWDGDFNGDWYTDGQTARVWNPNWGGAEAGAPIPTTTGFWKFLDVCPAAGATLNVSAKLTTNFTDPLSDTTLVVYYFDRGGALLSTVANHPLRDTNDRTFAIYDSAIPASTRRIAIAPMMLLAATEQGAAFYDSIDVGYEVAGSYTTTSVATDAFNSYSNSSLYGGNQPTGWSEFGGDWYAMATQKWVTLGNPNGATGGKDTGLVKQFSLVSKYSAGDVINARIFAAATFSDPTSYVRLRLVFNTANGPVIESDRQVRGYGLVDIRRQPIPAGAVSVYAIVNSYLGPNEKSSLYVDDFSLTTQKKK